SESSAPSGIRDVICPCENWNRPETLGKVTSPRNTSIPCALSEGESAKMKVPPPGAASPKPATIEVVPPEAKRSPPSTATATCPLSLNENSETELSCGRAGEKSPVSTTGLNLKPVWAAIPRERSIVATERKSTFHTFGIE